MAIEDAPIIKVLDFDEAEAYNPDRPISSLIRTQLLHLHHAEYILVPAESRTNININDLLTERQASDYIHRVTTLLHRFGKSGKAKKSTKTKETSVRKSVGGSAKKATRNKPESH